MKKYTIISIGLFISCLLILAYGCEEDEQNNKPTCSITEPLQDAEFLKGKIITIIANADDEDGNLREVRFYIDDEGVSSTSDFPYKYEWNTSAVSLGNYTLKAEAIDEKNAKAESTITVSIIDNQLGADFLADKTTITLGDTINFTDQSGSIPSTWEWQFGDGGSSTEQNPSYVYSNAGIYSVSLIVTNDFTSDTETKSNYITVQALPIISTNSISEYSSTIAIVGGNVTNDGFSNITDRGIYSGTTTNPENDGTKFQIDSGTGIFSDTITGLTINTTYYVCAYATNSIGTQYGNAVSFITENGLPKITTSEISSITAISAVSGGEITDDGDFDITARGVCWSTNSNPNIEDDKTIDGTGIGDFNSNISNLEVNTTYYVRAYATNSTGTSYGNELSFTTDDGLPTLATTEITDITATTATSGGNITDNGGIAITARGVCWSTNTCPIISDNITTNGSGIGSFTSSLTGLSINTTYYVRAYATNSIGTTYGNQLSFTTDNGVPTITTVSISNITASSATSGGNITDDGGLTLTARGVCWSISSNPTISDNYTSDGTGSGSFTSNIVGLTEWTGYYLRAYVTNSIGTTYGNELFFEAKETLTDYDGNNYEIIKIGDQVWMAENLKTKHYSDGIEILLVEGETVWNFLTETDKAYCYYANSLSNLETYGALYTWAAAMNGALSSDMNPSGIQGVCPNGWHMPSDAEWKELEMYLGMSQVDADAIGWRGTDEGGEMKETGTTHWKTPNTGATNESGFTALPGGHRSSYGPFNNLGATSHFWSATENDGSSVWVHHVQYNISTVYRINEAKPTGFSVRCLRD